MTTVSFSASVDKWVGETKERASAVFRGSAQELFERVVKATPVDTGYLRASYQVVVNGSLPPANKTGEGTAPTPPVIAATIANLQIGDNVSLGYTAVYARRLHYGFTGQDSLGRNYNQPPWPWVTTEAAQWQQIVKGQVARARASAR